MIATIIFAPMAAMLVQAAISRSREFLADAGGAKIAGTPYGLMNALRKLEMGSKQIPLDANPATSHMFIMKPFSGGGLLSMFSTHPPTEQRIQALMNLAVVSRRVSNRTSLVRPAGLSRRAFLCRLRPRFDTRYFFCSILTIPRTSFA